MKNDMIQKRSISQEMEQIVIDATEIDTNKVANEVLDWLITNVEQFIDNQVRIFKIDLAVEGESTPPMPEMRKLQALFKNIPEDNTMVKALDVMKADGTIDMSKFKSKNLTKAVKVRSHLDEITQSCLIDIQKNTEKLQKLFERMAYYYEMIGIHNGNLLIRNLTGAVSINNFQYEAFSVDVDVQSPTFQIQKGDGTVAFVESERKQYTIPEGFTVWVEISLNDKTQSTSVF